MYSLFASGHDRKWHNTSFILDAKGSRDHWGYYPFPLCEDGELRRGNYGGRIWKGGIVGCCTITSLLVESLG